jgi:hypothetical protein
MTATTINRPAPLELSRAIWRFVFGTLLMLVLVAGAFAIGRASAPTHTVRSVVTVPAAPTVSIADTCHPGRPC